MWACRARGRHGTKYTEEMEDAELLQDERKGGTGHRLSMQPSVVKGGTMREYQLQGLNWLIHLYDNGINGILADEMVRRADVRCRIGHSMFACRFVGTLFLAYVTAHML